MQDIKEFEERLDLKRTEELFDASIKSSDALSGKPYDENALKAARMTVSFGNLHVNTAKTKLSASRIIGYRDETSRLKENLDRRIRDEKKYGTSN